MSQTDQPGDETIELTPAPEGCVCAPASLRWLDVWVRKQQFDPKVSLFFSINSTTTTFLTHAALLQKTAVTPLVLVGAACVKRGVRSRTRFGGFEIRKCDGSLIKVWIHNAIELATVPVRYGIILEASGIVEASAHK